jgi:hypothetical protein
MKRIKGFKFFRIFVTDEIEVKEQRSGKVKTSKIMAKLKFSQPPLRILGSPCYSGMVFRVYSANH